jgi:pheromone shutdown protein TraB
MAKEFIITMQVDDCRLCLILQGQLTDLAIKKILRAAEAGLQIFPVVMVEVQEATGTTEGVLAILEEGLRQLISEKKQAF